MIDREEVKIITKNMVRMLILRVGSLIRSMIRFNKWLPRFSFYLEFSAEHVNLISEGLIFSDDAEM